MISYGIDIGTTTFRALATQISIDALGRRDSKILSEPLCVFTPFKSDRSIDDKRLLEILDAWLTKNTIPPPDLGTVLFTGEAQRAQNALQLGEALTSRWEGLLSAQLDPKLESRIAAFGSSAVQLSERHIGRPVIHIDIGGGTSNFAWIENGEILDCACLNIGCRKWIFDTEREVLLSSTREGNYLSKLANVSPEKEPQALCDLMVRFLLEFSQGKTSEELKPLVVIPWGKTHGLSILPLISISGGVIECRGESNLKYGDLGPLFIMTLENQVLSRRGEVFFSPEHGRATAIGAANYGFHLSGSSFHVDEGFHFPIRNIPVFTENSFDSVDALPKLFALQLNPSGTEASNIQCLADFWIEKLKNLGKETGVLFLLPANIGKSFGYFLSKAKNFPTSAVLDEIPLETSISGIQTLDVIPAEDNHRYFVIFKTLLLF